MSGFSKFKQLLGIQKESSFVKRDTFFESVFQSTLNAYIIYSKDTLEVKEINKMASTFFELPPDKDLKGLYMPQVMMRYLSGDSPNLEFLMNNVGENWSGEATFITHNKRKFYASVNTNILPPGIHEEYQIFSIIDITAMKEAHEEVKSANRKVALAASSKGRFLSSMSHELRTPLNGIIGTSNIILSDSGLKEEIKKHINVIRYSSEHMLDIVNDILDFSKIDAQKMVLKEKPCNLLNCLENITSAFAVHFDSQDIELVADYDSEELKDLEIITDQTKLIQVIKNLLSNALKFTHEGKVTLVVKVLEVSDSGAKVSFKVTDTGMGIAKEKQEEIFEAFSQVHDDDLKRKYGGTGLGLTISRQLVNIMGGELKVESELNQGSAFNFTLHFKIPVKPVESVDSISSLPLQPVKKDIRGVRVLIVEDNDINSNILKSFLTRWQMPVKVAITGVHALELIKYHKFDLILMDLEMPQMDGYTALKKIREQNIDTPVIAFTASLLDDMDSLINESGFTDYVLKPYKPSVLKKKIEMYCERKVDYV